MLPKKSKYLNLIERITPIVGANTIQKAAERRKRSTIFRSTRSSRSKGVATELTASSHVGPEANEVVDHPDQKNDVNGAEPLRDNAVPLIDPGELVVADLGMLVLLFSLDADASVSLLHRAHLTASSNSSSGRGRSSSGCNARGPKLHRSRSSRYTMASACRSSP